MTVPPQLPSNGRDDSFDSRTQLSSTNLSGISERELLEAVICRPERTIEISQRDFLKYVSDFERKIKHLSKTFSLHRSPSVMNDQEREALCDVTRIASTLGEWLYSAKYYERAHHHFQNVLQIDDRLLTAGYEVNAYGFDLINVGRTLFALGRYDDSEHCIQAGIKSFRRAFPDKIEDTTEILRAVLIAVTNCAEQHEESERLRLLSIPRNLATEFPTEIKSLYAEFPNLLRMNS